MTDAEIARKMAKDGEPSLFGNARLLYEDQVAKENAEKSGPKSMADIVAARMNKPKDRRTQKGEILKYFNEHITNKAGKRYGIPFFARKLQGMELEDLYFLKSVCEQESKRTYEDKATGKIVQITVGMVFWREIKVK